MHRIFLALLAIACFSCVEEFDGTGVVIDKDYDDPDVERVAGHWEDGEEVCEDDFGYDDAVDDYLYDIFIDVEFSELTGCFEYEDEWVEGYSYLTPAHWTLRIRDLKSDKVHTISVPDDVYDECRVGQHYDTNAEECQSG